MGNRLLSRGHLSLGFPIPWDSDGANQSPSSYPGSARAVQSYSLYAWHPAECLHWGPAETSGQQVHGHKSHVTRQGLLIQPQALKPILGPREESRLLGLGEKGKIHQPKTCLVLVPAAPLGLMKLVRREKAQKCVSPPSPPSGLSLPPTLGASLCLAVGTGWSPWPVGTSISEVQPRLGGHTAMAPVGPEALAGQTRALAWTPSELQMQLESC